MRLFLLLLLVELLLVELLELLELSQRTILGIYYLSTVSDIIRVLPRYNFQMVVEIRSPLMPATTYYSSNCTLVKTTWRKVT